MDDASCRRDARSRRPRFEPGALPADRHDWAVLPPAYFDIATVLGLVAAIAALAADALGLGLALLALSAVAAVGAKRSQRERR